MATPEPPTHADGSDQDWQLLLRLGELVRRHTFAACEELGLRPAQAEVLQQLVPGQLVRVTDLAHTHGCEVSNITGIADRLEAQGLVERKAVPGDRRAKALVLTPAGLQRRQQLLERLAQEPPELAPLSPADRRLLGRLLAAALPGQPRRG
jgi:MarR family transcriptional regulator, organic hydroperoxide resistance regulator